ncbi:MAG: cobalamin-binding protein [Acidobacteriota bacterium]|jgi:iron complex transport system substrate-binding protein
MLSIRRDSIFHLPWAGLSILILFGACSRSAPHGREQTASTAALSISYTDGIGRNVNLPRHPLRIISLAPSVTEVVYMLGADDRLIGVTTECDWPEAAKRKPKIGSLLNPNYENILAARPDLIIASTAGNDRAAVYRLAELGLPVFVTAPRSVEGIMEATRQIGLITDRAPDGERLVAEMKARLQEIKRRLAGLPPVRAFFITWFDPLLAPGSRTFENDALRLANVVSISADSREYYPRYSLEQVLTRNPDVILTVFHSGQPLPELKKIAGWRALDAVKGGRVYVLDEVFQHPSPRFVDGVEELARKLHPERFQ